MSDPLQMPPHDPPVPPVSPVEAGDTPDFVVPRGIIKWSKWRQATLRAAHREARQQLRSLSQGPAPPRPDPRSLPS